MRADGNPGLRQLPVRPALASARRRMSPLGNCHALKPPRFSMRRLRLLDAAAGAFRPIAAAARAKARAIFPAQGRHRSREQRLLAHFLVENEHAAVVAWPVPTL